MYFFLFTMLITRCNVDVNFSNVFRCFTSFCIVFLYLLLFNIVLHKTMYIYNNRNSVITGTFSLTSLKTNVLVITSFPLQFILFLILFYFFIVNFLFHTLFILYFLYFLCYRFNCYIHNITCTVLT